MARFAANLSWLYTELPFLDRFAAAAADGFTAVECMSPYDHAPELIAEHLHANGQRMVLINAPAGNWAGGERGLACLPLRKSEFRAAIHTALDYARAITCPRIHVLAGLGADADCYVANLQWAAAQAAEIELCIEPINATDMPGYFLSRQSQALDLIDAIGAPNVRLQFDGYHCEISEGEVVPHLRRAFEQGVLGHVQVAGVPGRNEPINADWLSELDVLGYSGFVGLEYRPRAGTREGLGWIKAW